MLTALGVVLGSLLAVALVLLIARERLRAPGARRGREGGTVGSGGLPHDRRDGGGDSAPGGSDGGDGGGGGD